ncbi:MAG: putative manganese transporter [bacterium]
MNWEPIIEAAKTALRVGVIILPIFVIVDYFNHRYGHKVEHKLEKSKKMMPLFAALFGMLPGCNVAVVIAILFTEGIATLGTLVAAIIAISDEAIYVFIPLGIEKFIPILLAKLIIAITAGYLVDFFPGFKIRRTKIEKEIEFCCAQHPHHDGLKGEIIHAIKHAIRVVFIVFITLAIFNYIQDTYTMTFLNDFFANILWLQPFLASLVGLIPGCGTSIAIATLYIEKIITFGAVVAGLSAAGGEVFVVLAARGIKWKNLAQIALILVVISTVAGTLIDIFIK